MQHIASVEDLCGEEWIKIGLPYGIGAGLAGGNWDEILNVIERVSNEFNREIYLYQLTAEKSSKEN